MRTSKEIKSKVLKKDLFRYKNGFYELPYLINSPQSMIEGFKKLPSIKFNEENQFISTKTPALDITVYWREVERGLFFIYSEVLFKENVCFRHFDDRSEHTGYCCLSLRIDNYSKINNSLADGISYTDNSWLMFKSGARVDHHHFKGTKGNYFSLYFTPEWIKNYFKRISQQDKKLLNLFLKSDSEYLICRNIYGQKIYNSNYLRNQFAEGKKTHLNKLRYEADSFLSFFISKMKYENINERHFLVSNLERIKVLKAENIMTKCLFEKFPGIPLIAKDVGLSGTKLKECFRLVYDKTPFQYFRNTQMKAARKLIEESDLTLNQIARKFGYENAGKFATAFKSQYNSLPSDVRSSSLNRKKVT